MGLWTNLRYYNAICLEGWGCVPAEIRTERLSNTRQKRSRNFLDVSVLYYDNGRESNYVLGSSASI